MYNLSNIVYSVDYGFANNIPAEAAPVANNVAVVEEGTTLTGCYSYSDANGDLEGKSTYQWYLSDEPVGTSKQVINGATSRTYAQPDPTKYYFFEVTPVALTGLSGTLTGSPTISAGFTAAAAVESLPPEIMAVNSASDADTLLAALNRLDLANVIAGNKAFYWTAKQTVTVQNLSDIQTNIVTAGNNSAAVHRASGLRIYANTGSEVWIYVTDQYGNDYNTQVSGVTVTVSGGTSSISSVRAGSITGGAVGGQQLTLDTDQSGAIGLILNLDPTAQIVTISAANVTLSAHPRSIVTPVPTSLEIDAQPLGAGQISVPVAVRVLDQNGNNYYGVVPGIQVTVAGGTSKIASVYSQENIIYGTATGGSLGTQAVTFSTTTQGILAFNMTLDAPADQTVAVNATNGTLTANQVSVVFSTIATSLLASYTPITFTQTGDIIHNNVQYQTAAAVIAALPATIAVTLANQTVVNVPVSWANTDVYSAATAASYTFTATWGAMPAGADNSNNLAAPTVEVPVAQGTTSPLASYSAVTFTQTGNVSGNNVQYADAAAVNAALPATIAVTLANQTVVNVPLTWADTDGYSAATAASYTFTAAWGAMPVGADNSNALAAPTVEVAVVQ